MPLDTRGWQRAVPLPRLDAPQGARAGSRGGGVSDQGNGSDGWRKSSFSGSNNECVEVRRGKHAVEVRDSKNPHGYVLRFTTAEWSAFVDGVRAGEFDT
ncbi:DUF397 domain-containing protein [Actinomycetes bacterium KLBMP 9759]